MLIHYVWWHYTTAIADLVRNYVNIASFLTHFFSLKHLSRNLFAPWRRLGEEYPVGAFDFKAILTAALVNTLMRIVGLIIRLLLIIIGLIALFISLIGFFFVLFVWLAMPAVLIFLIVFSIKLLLF